MKSSKLYLLSAVIVASFAGNLKAAHITETRPIELAVTRFEILSQNLADQQNNKSLNMPVVIRKDIDAFVEDLGRVPVQKDIASLREQLIKKYRLALIHAINNQLDVRRESDEPTLRQLLQAQYGEQEKEPVQRFAQDLIERYTSRAKSLARRMEKTPEVHEKSIVDFALYKNALLASLFDFQERDFSAGTIEEISADGEWLLVVSDDGKRTIYRRQDDDFVLHDAAIKEPIRAVSRDFSVIIAGDLLSDTARIYKLNKTSNRWVPEKIINNEQGLRLSEDGSVIVIRRKDMINSYVRQGDSWQEQKPIVFQKNQKLPHKITLSPRGLIMILHLELGQEAYERGAHGWEKTTLPAGHISFSNNDSLMHVSTSFSEKIYARDSKNNWQERQSFKEPFIFLGNGSELFERFTPAIYVKKSDHRWHKQQEIVVPIDYDILNIGVTSSDNGAILILSWENLDGKENEVFAQHGDHWYTVRQFWGEDVQPIIASSADGLVLAAYHYVYFLPEIVLKEVKKINSKQWQLMNDLYSAHLLASLNKDERKYVLLNAKQMEIFNTLPEIFRDQILKRWHVISQETYQMLDPKKQKVEASRAS